MNNPLHDRLAEATEASNEAIRTAILSGNKPPKCTCLCPSGWNPLGHGHGCPMRVWLEADTGTGEGER